jgi:hypothetical protein
MLLILLFHIHGYEVNYYMSNVSLYIIVFLRFWYFEVVLTDMASPVHV